jgi:hypothetical protein
VKQLAKGFLEHLVELLEDPINPDREVKNKNARFYLWRIP